MYPLKNRAHFEGAPRGRPSRFRYPLGAFTLKIDTSRAPSRVRGSVSVCLPLRSNVYAVRCQLAAGGTDLQFAGDASHPRATRSLSERKRPTRGRRAGSDGATRESAPLSPHTRSCLPPCSACRGISHSHSVQRRKLQSPRIEVFFVFSTPWNAKV